MQPESHLKREGVEALQLREEEPTGLTSCDEETFRLLYDRYFPRVYRFAMSRLHNRTDTEDAVQEIFIAVFQSLSSFEGKAPLLSWIYGIARNVINNQIRRSKVEAQHVEKTPSRLTRSVASLDLCTPEQALNLRRCTDALQNQLDEASDWQAAAFEMRHFENLPINEIAQRVQRSNTAVRCGLYRVKQKVFRAVSPGDREPPEEKKGEAPGVDR